MLRSVWNFCMFVGEIMNLSCNFITLGRFMLSNNRKLWYSVGISSEQHSLHFCVYTLRCKNLQFSLVSRTVACWKTVLLFLISLCGDKMKSWLWFRERPWDQSRAILLEVVYCQHKPLTSHATVGSPALERYRAAGVNPEEDYKGYYRNGAPLLLGEAERIDILQPGGEQALGRP